MQPEAAAAISDVLNESLDTREQRAGRRDLVLFILGAIVSAAINFGGPPLWGFLADLVV